jgi:predicted DNA-binding transcriptional regulator AlpA
VKLIEFKQLKPEKGIKYTKDYLRIKWKRGEFPVPVHLSTMHVAWVEDEIDAWLANLRATRDARLAETAAE